MRRDHRCQPTWAGSPRSRKPAPSSAFHCINLWTRERFCIGSALLSYMCYDLRRGSMSDNCRANLEACWLNAERASSEGERRAWLEMAAAWRLLVAIGDPPSAPEHCVVVERSSPLANRLIKISKPRQWWIRQVGTYIWNCRASILFNARTLSIHPFIQLMVRARRCADKAAELVRALFLNKS